MARIAKSLALCAVLAGLVTLAGAPLTSQEIHFSTENDIFVHNPTPDDLYTFSTAFEVERRGLRYAWRENAFTDRAAGIRFDESQLAAGRELRMDGAWTPYLEAGIVHVGEGLLGERAQNTLHRAIGASQVELSYIDSSWHLRGAGSIERWIHLGQGFDAGPRFEAEVIPGLRSRLVVAGQGHWQRRPSVGIDLLVGGRADRVALDALEPHVPSTGMVARLAVTLADTIVASWSYNEMGDRREHLGLTYRLPLSSGREPR